MSDTSKPTAAQRYEGLAQYTAIQAGVAGSRGDHAATKAYMQLSASYSDKAAELAKNESK